MKTASLADQFLGHLDEEVRDTFAAVDDLGERLAHALKTAREAHPKIAIDDEAIMAHLARHMLGHEPTNGFEHLRSDDLLLALGSEPEYWDLRLVDEWKTLGVSFEERRVLLAGSLTAFVRAS